DRYATGGGGMMTGGGMTTVAVGADPAVARRRAIEALRAGVPSRDAVAATGSGQAAIEDSFASLRAAAAAGHPGGLLLGGGFGAGLALFAQVRQRDPAFANTIVRFWSGDPIATPELRRRLKEIGEARPSLPPVAVRELGVQRLRFAAKLLAAAGSAGWVIFFDEVELIGRYSLQQRARSYAEIVRWVRGEHGSPGVPIAAVLAMTDDFEAAVITGRNDRELLPERLRAK